MFERTIDDTSQNKTVSEKQTNPNPTNNNNESNKIERIKRLRGRRNFNCHECFHQGNSSKNLLRHSRETGHTNIDNLEEQCFTCDQILPNFEELMKHRKSSHSNTINFCRYYKENSCRFQDNCWYKHDSQTLSSRSQNDVRNSQMSASNFQSSQEQFPPDQMNQITVMLKDLLTKYYTSEEGKKKRSPGGH